jgi:hypothetical protein
VIVRIRDQQQRGTRPPVISGAVTGVTTVTAPIGNAGLGAGLVRPSPASSATRKRRPAATRSPAAFTSPPTSRAPSSRSLSSRSSSTRSTRNQPDMPRCITSVSPDESGVTRYFARRVTDITRVPIRRAAKFSGSGPRKSARRAITASKRAPAITGSSIRRTVSTSGNSGMTRPVRPACLA